MTYTRTQGGCATLGAVSGSWAQIVAKDGYRYQITDDDVLWAARAARYEGHDAADTLWTWTQRLALPNIRTRWPTLAALIKAHSQPVNPIWRRDGEKCRPGGSHHGTDYCEEARLRRRDEAATIAFDALPAEVRNKTLAWARAEVPNPVPRATDFAAPNVTRSFMNQHPDSRLVKQAGNWFVTSYGSENWPSDQVVMQHEGRVAGPSAATFRIVAIGGAVLAASAAFAAFAWSRRH